VITAAAVALARPRGWHYLNRTHRASGGQPPYPVASLGWSQMAHPLSTPQQLPGALPPARRIARAMVVAAAALGVALLLGALVLWFHYGTAVFFEMIASGISACF
jgi:hypothetical protein